VLHTFELGASDGEVFSANQIQISEKSPDLPLDHEDDSIMFSETSISITGRQGVTSEKTSIIVGTSPKVANVTV